MATIRAYTTIEQSRKLAEILPIESADMCYKVLPGIKESMPDQYIAIVPDDAFFESDISAWSFAALLGVLPKSLMCTPNPTLDGYCCKNIMHDLETYGSNPIDACYELILKLNELKML